MADDSSKRLLDRYCEGDSQAAKDVFDRYVTRLLELARRRISARLRRRIDAEDVVQSALRSFFARAANEAYVLQRAGDLWRLLAAITLSKVRRHVEVHTAAKRSIGRESAAGAIDVAVLADRNPTPEEEAGLVDELEHLMQICNPAQREAVQMRLAGETVESISAALDRSQRTVRRLLQSACEELAQRLASEER